MAQSLMTPPFAKGGVGRTKTVPAGRRPVVRIGIVVVVPIELDLAIVVPVEVGRVVAILGVH